MDHYFGDPGYERNSGRPDAVVGMVLSAISGFLVGICLTLAIVLFV